VICRGPDRSDDEPTYVLLADGPASMPGLARRGTGRTCPPLHRRARPGRPRRLRLLAGPAAGPASRGFELVAGELEEVDAAGEPAWMLAGADLAGTGDAAPCVRLLPHFDEHLLGYRSRDMAPPPRFARRIQAGGGWVRAAVLVDGRVAGTWRQQRLRDHIVVTVEPFETTDPAALPGLEAEAADLGRFQHTVATLHIASS
jgi:Winged helix DNA-binding domain